MTFVTLSVTILIMRRLAKRSLLFEGEYDYYDVIEKKKRQRNKDGYESERLWKYLAMLTTPNKKQEKHFNKMRRSYRKYGEVSNNAVKYRDQLCTMKCSYVPNNLKKHSFFLRNYMTQKGKSDVEKEAVLFNDSEDVVSEESILEYEKNMSPKFFRWIVSPGNQGMPMEELVRRLMKKVEKATGYKLSWFAARHTDTSRVHCHVLINGVDKNGKDVFFDRKFISETLRKFASETCTELVGLRTDLEIEADRKKLPLSRRFCRIDESIKKFEVELNKELYDEKNLKEIDSRNYSSSVIAQDDTMLQRLNFLAEIGFAKKLKRNGKKFLLEKGWEDKLRTLGRYNCFYEARKLLKYCYPRDFVEYKSDMGKISGEITNVFIKDFEESWINAILIEDKDKGKAWFVPVREVPDRKLIGKQVDWRTIAGSRGRQSLFENLKVLS